MTGDPELPPMMSLVVTKSNGVVRVRRSFAFSHEAGRSNGGSPVARVKAPPSSVNGGTWDPSSWVQPRTEPYDSRAVNVASGEWLGPPTWEGGLAVGPGVFPPP